MEVKMMSTQIDLEQILQTLDKLRPDELWLVEEHIANLKKRNQRFFPPKTLLDDDAFLISFDDYLALSDEARDDIQLYAYDKYRSWIDGELARRHARGMIVCGGKIIEWFPKLDDYPSDEKMEAIGMQFGYAPFVFIANPVIFIRGLSCALR
jgi:hypothetical protein